MYLVLYAYDQAIVVALGFIPTSTNKVPSI